MAHQKKRFKNNEITGKGKNVKQYTNIKHRNTKIYILRKGIY